MSRLDKIPLFGTLSNLIKEELVEPTIDQFLRSVRGYGALGDLPKPIKLKYKKISESIAIEDKSKFAKLKNSYKKINSLDRLISLISTIDK